MILDENDSLAHDPTSVPQPAVAREPAADAGRNEEIREIFLGRLGHDLRNPLAAILTSARLTLRRGALPASEQKSIARIVSSGERMERMIGQLLDSNRTRQPGGIPLHRDQNDVSQSVVRAVEHARVGHPDAVVELDVERESEHVAHVDSERVEQVLSTLIENAIVHGPPGRPVRVSIRSGEGHVTVAVHNEGTPVPVERQRSLFDPFTRAHSPKLEHSSALGLGLYIAEHIVLAHRGAITLDSNADTGTTLSFTVARAAPEDGARR